LNRNIAITGLKGSGKGTLASYLVTTYNYTELSFAHAVKDVLSSIFDWPRHLLEGDTSESRRFRDTVDAWWSQELNIKDFTPRMAMQFIATDLFRDRFHSDTWALTVKRKIKDTHVVISDMRFMNEYKVTQPTVDIVVKVLPAKTPVWYNIAKQALEGDNDAFHDMLNSFPEVHKSEWETTIIPADIILRNDSTIADLALNFEQQIRQLDKPQ